MSDRAQGAVEWRTGMRLLGRHADPIIRAIVRNYVEANFTDEMVGRLATEIARKISLMPLHFGIVILLLTHGFSASGVARFGHGAARLTREQVSRLLQAWSSAPLGLCRDLTQFYERLANFIAYSMPRI
jgi:hypothetical protein